MGLLIAYLLIALIVSFTCSVLESVILTAPLSYTQVLKRQARELHRQQQKGSATGDRINSSQAQNRVSEKDAGAAKKIEREIKRKIKGSIILQKMKTDVEKPLSAILSLNTVAHTVGAAGVGAQSLEIFGSVYVGITSAVLTLLILVFSEIMPKSIGTRYWKKIVIPSCYISQFMVWICYPLVWLSEGITYMVTKGKPVQAVSLQEVEAVVSMGSKEGVFVEEETRSLRSILEVRNLRVRDVMTPRIVAVTIDETTTLKEFFRKKNYLKYSRIPVYRSGNPEYITGFVLLKNVFMLMAEDRFDKELSTLKRPLMVCTESQKVLNLWEQMRKRKEQIAMVVDEYGSFVGIITMEDLVETMLGREIVDEKDTITDLQKYARDKGQS